MDSALHTYIVYQLGLRHIPQSAIAACAGVSPAMVSQVIRGTKRSERVQAVLISALGFHSWVELVELHAAAYRFQALVKASSK